MRFILAIVCILFAQQVNADFAAFIKAVEEDDIPQVLEILDSKNDDGSPVVAINQCDDEGRPPVFFASSPQMLQTLLERGAAVYGTTLDVAHLPRVDRQGMNALHFLLAVTAPRLFAEFPQQGIEIMRRIEATAYLLMRLARQNEFRGRATVRLEAQQDYRGRVAANFVEGEGEFLRRLRGQHLQAFLPPPEGGFRAAAARKLAKERELMREFERIKEAERREAEAQRERQNARMQAIIDAVLNFDTLPTTARITAPVLTLVAPLARRLSGFERRSHILTGPQWWIDQQNAKQDSAANSNNE